MTKQEKAQQKRERRQQRVSGFAAVQEPRTVTKTRNSKRAMHDMLNWMMGLSLPEITAMLTAAKAKRKETLDKLVDGDEEVEEVSDETAQVEADYTATEIAILEAEIARRS